ncbi:glycosyltransferase family 2 protein [Pseudomonas sp. QL9]|uniref:glycosyltransferase family 2 protein n=1 Tax=Pseudomonas TaxID=286 RepID=UPI00352A6014
MTQHLSFGTHVRRTFGIKLGVLHQGGTCYQLKQVPMNDAERCRPPQPRISLVTPSFNQGKFIGQTIQSVLTQEYSNLEYIVQDNQSNDGTLEILKTVTSPNFSFHIEKDTGQADAINRGFSHCSGEIMGFLNSDDILLPGALEYIARVFQENPQVDAVYGNRVLLDTQDNIVGRWVLPYHDGELLRHIDYVPQETLFWRRSLWERVGGRLNDKLAFALDWDLLLRFLDGGARFVHVPRFLGGFRIHQEQKTISEYASKGIHEMRQLRRNHAPNSLSKTLMPLRHFIFLLKHIYADRQLSTFLKAASK